MSATLPTPPVVDDLARVRRSLAMVRSLLDELELSGGAHPSVGPSWRRSVASQLGDELGQVADVLHDLAAVPRSPREGAGGRGGLHPRRDGGDEAAMARPVR